jgi:hypothetical protein
LAPALELKEKNLKTNNKKPQHRAVLEQLAVESQENKTGL